jgi:hypothetical protein
MDGKKKTQQEGNEPSLNVEEAMKLVQEEGSGDTQEKKIVIKEEDTNDEEFDFEDVLVLPAEGLLIKQNEDEVRLLFFYVKPSISDTLTYKAVTELRIPRKHFLHIADDIQQTMMEYTKTGQAELHLPMYG